MSESNKQVEKTWDEIDGSFDDALAQCITEEQRADLRTQHNKARTAWLAAQSKVFDEKNPKVQETREKREKANEDLKTAKQNFDDIVAFLKVAAAAVDLAASLAKLAMA